MMIYALIPARSGSKRVKNKNIRPLSGIPLMVWSIIAARQCPLIDRVFVSTDSQEYARIAEARDAEIVMRSPEAASDTAGDYEVVSQFLNLHPCDLIVYLRPTTPFRTADRIEQAIKIMIDGPYDSLRSVEEMPESAFKCFRIRAGLLRPLTKIDLTDAPNQSLERTYHPNGYGDIVRPKIVRAGSLWGNGRFAFITPRTVEIDTEEDFQYAEYFAQKERRFEFGKTTD